VVVRSADAADGHEIIVEDDGPGFNQEQLLAPIAPFVSEKPAGTGLGLYTVERLVAASRGAFHRTNRPDGGARVSVTLPWSAR
jgi:signal transduction histidine kinase